MRKGTLRIAIAAVALLGLGASGVKAETPDLGITNNTLELRVINNNASVVRVYVQDAEGRMYQLGRVAALDFGIMEIPGEIAASGDVRIKVFPSEPVWSLQGGSDGIRTRGLSLKLGDAVNMFVETNLDESQVEIVKG